MVRSRSVTAVGLVILHLCAYSSAGALASDLDMLTRVLIPAYMAQDLAAVCVRDDPGFLAVELSGGIGLVAAYAQHVKKEVTIGISEQDAVHVRLNAANAAREVARQELYALTGQQRAGTAGALKRWCERSAKPFILKIMMNHEEKHRLFDKIVKGAKR